MRAGWSFDVTTADADGKRWDFNQMEMRNRAVRRVLTDQPLFPIGSPMYIAFSAMNRINYSKTDKAEVEAKMAYGSSHLELCAKLYAIQWKAGRYFLHEHLAEASSWHEECRMKMLKRQGGVKVVGGSMQIWSDVQR